MAPNALPSSHEVPETYLQVHIAPLPEPFTYRFTNPSPDIPIGPGWRVAVPFGSRQTFGFVAGVCSDLPESSSSYTIKNITEVSPSFPVFDSDQLEFFDWISRYYRVPSSLVFDQALPKVVPPKSLRVVSRVTSKQDGADAGLGPRQKSILSFLKQHGPSPYEQLALHHAHLSSSLRALVRRGLVQIDERQEIPGTLSGSSAPTWAKTNVVPTKEQTEVIDAVSQAVAERTFETHLLHGVTGSGKTEVYIECMRACLAAGMSCLVIVPEIALTPQLLDRFRARILEPIATLHSAVPPKQRWNAWCALLHGKARIAVGARSAIFAPAVNLGLIIVDEEHDPSFKQSDGFRYNGRDLAIARGMLAHCPVLLGSATPSLESYYHARRGKYSYHQLASLHPEQEKNFTIVDLRSTGVKGMKSSHVSMVLFHAIEQALREHGQVFLLYNRRGFARVLECLECGWVEYCPNCSVSLTYHKRTRKLCCHYCGLETHQRPTCPKCIEKDPATPGKLQLSGAGTEKIFDEVRELFPDSSVARLDRDAAQNAESYQEILDRLRSHQIDILVGTQMIAKGHDLPEVRLVGILDADVGLHIPDFRANERVYQLLTQAAGRAGREGGGARVFIQTRSPQHPSIALTLHEDFLSFALGELRQRKDLLYPPYRKLLRIVAMGPSAEIALQTLNTIRQRLSQPERDIRLLGPSAAPLERLRGRWRAHLLVFSHHTAELQRIVDGVMQFTRTTPSSLKIVCDLDPQELL